MNQNGYVIEKRGSIHYYNNKDQLHRDDDLPAVIQQTKFLTETWYQNGQIHRDGDLPAIVRNDGYQVWYRHGQIHRDNDLPAKISASGTKWWYQHNKIHRNPDFGPAIVSEDGQVKHYFVDGVEVHL